VRPNVLRSLVAVALAALPRGAALVSACVSDKIGNKGASCERASECAGGLICAENVCTDDLSKLDGGTAANFNDTGSMMVDAPAEGAADGPPPDAPMTDTGTPPEDTGSPPVDTGTPPPVDTGTMPEDTGTAPVDTGTPPDDTSTGD
jgi:hypothetical protein